MHLAPRPALATIRRARRYDVDDMLRVQDRLSLHATAPTVHGRTGGVPSATDLEWFEAAVREDLVHVLEVQPSGLVGFAVVQPWQSLRGSPVWTRMSRVRHARPGALEEVERGPGPAYFQQLAVLPQGRPRGAYLALHALEDALSGHARVLAATVTAPAADLAAIRLMREVGFVALGELDEWRDGVGPVTSQLHLLRREDYLARRRSPRFAALMSHARRESPSDLQPFPDLTRRGGVA